MKTNININRLEEHYVYTCKEINELLVMASLTPGQVELLVHLLDEKELVEEASIER